MEIFLHKMKSKIGEFEAKTPKKWNSFCFALNQKFMNSRFFMAVVSVFGGGAWGNGGDGYNVSGGSGPGGNTFGKGGSTGTSYWAGSAAGAWCLRDFTSNTFESGVGIKTGSSLSIGTVELYYINNQITI